MAYLLKKYCTILQYQMASKQFQNRVTCIIVYYSSQSFTGKLQKLRGLNSI